MATKIILFGQLAEIAGNSNLVLEDVADTNELLQKLQSCYPALAHSKYRVAVDKKMISENTTLSNDTTVALLPPFSGG
ncbi:MAG: MoaD/ThiS family protein [Flavisolibacter sp.]|nr:MoaD/ThiS family protein [Flavisolibacter sp.]